MPMDLSPKRFADTVVLAPTGRIDHSRSEDFRDALRPHLERCAAGQDHLVLDLSGVDYISSAGLRVLMLARKQAKAQGSVVKEIFEISRFTVVFDIFATVREALGRVSPAALAAFDAA
jgi:anti-anti-sigma factor